MAMTATTYLRRFRPYPEYKDSGVKWLGEIPSGWRTMRLKYAAPLSEIRGDGEHEDLPYVALEHIQSQTGRLVGEFEAVGGDDTAVAFRAGDVLFGKLRPYLAKVYLASFDGTCSGELLVLRSSANVQPSNLTYQLLSSGFIDWVNAMTYGTKMPRAKPSQVADTRIALAPFGEQETIAAFLDRETAKIDALIEKKERLIELLQEKRAAMIMQAVTKGLDPGVPMKDSGVEWLGEIPAHWEVLKLSSLTKCLDGHRIPINAEDRGMMQGDYPYWGANSIVDHIDRWLFDEDLVLLGEDGAPFFDRTRPVAFHVTGKIWVNNHAHVLRPGKRIMPSFLAHVLNCVDYRAFIDGSTRDKLTQGDMNRIAVQVPAIEEQQAISDFLSDETSSLDSLAEEIRDGVTRLMELRSALISAAVTGKIDVREEVA